MRKKQAISLKKNIVAVSHNDVGSRKKLDRLTIRKYIRIQDLKKHCESCHAAHHKTTIFRMIFYPHVMN